jgi:AraC-like DNA-binding protein
LRRWPIDPVFRVGASSINMEQRSIGCVNARTQEHLSLAEAVSEWTAAVTPAVPKLPSEFVHSLLAVTRALGLDPDRLPQDAGLPPGLFEVSGQRIGYTELERLFKACEHAAACGHIGLLVGRELRLRDLGMAAGAALAAATAGEGLRNFVACCNLLDTPVTARLDVHDGRARFSCSITEHGIADTRHFDYLGAAITFHVLQDLCGPQWRASTVRFVSRKPFELAAFDSLFNTSLEFDAGTSEIEFDARWLDQPLPSLETGNRAAIVDELQQARTATLADLPAAMRRIMRKRLLLGDFSMDDVAAQLSMHRRTLDRRLQRHGTTYGELLESVRDDIARQLLRDTRFSIQRIAESVRFSSAANFATAFRRRAGMTPTEFRRQAS